MGLHGLFTGKVSLSETNVNTHIRIHMFIHAAFFSNSQGLVIGDLATFFSTTQVS
jgi:hypothetical protein